jgi:hypothetical protein
VHPHLLCLAGGDHAPTGRREEQEAGWAGGHDSVWPHQAADNRQDKCEDKSDSCLDFSHMAVFLCGKMYTYNAMIHH